MISGLFGSIRRVKAPIIYIERRKGEQRRTSMPPCCSTLHRGINGARILKIPRLFEELPSLASAP